LPRSLVKLFKGLIKSKIGGLTRTIAKLNAIDLLPLQLIISIDGPPSLGLGIGPYTLPT